MVAAPSRTTAMSESKYSNAVPETSNSTDSDLTKIDNKNGGRNTLKPDAAAKPMPIQIPTRASYSFTAGTSGSIEISYMAISVITNVISDSALCILWKIQCR